MKHLYQFLIIIGFSFLGEFLNHLIPLPIPAAVYGLVLLFLALQLKLVKLSQIQPCGNWLISIMGILFVAPTVNLLSSWEQIAPHLLPIATIMVVTTVLVFAVSGLVTRLFTKKEESDA